MSTSSALFAAVWATSNRSLASSSSWRQSHTFSLLAKTLYFADNTALHTFCNFRYTLTSACSHYDIWRFHSRLCSTSPATANMLVRASTLLKRHFSSSAQTLSWTSGLDLFWCHDAHKIQFLSSSSTTSSCLTFSSGSSLSWHWPHGTYSLPLADLSIIKAH